MIGFPPSQKAHVWLKLVEVKTMTSTTPSTSILGTRGLVVNILSWFLIVMSFMAVLTRMVTKYFVKRKISNDDWVIMSSLVSLIPSL